VDQRLGFSTAADGVRIAYATMGTVRSCWSLVSKPPDTPGSIRSCLRCGGAAVGEELIQALRRPKFLISPRVASTSLGEVSKLGDNRA
jgi:hypothetical protein